MRKIAIFLSFLIVLNYNGMATSILNAKFGVGVRGGYTASKFSSKEYSLDSVKEADKYFGSVVVNVDISSLRVELEYVFRPNFIKFGVNDRYNEVNYVSQKMIGVYYKLLPFTVIDLYTGAFVGINKIKGDFVKSYSDFAVGAGATVDINLLLVTFELGYRYIYIGEVTAWDNLTKCDLKSHDVFVGLKFVI